MRGTLRDRVVRMVRRHETTMEVFDAILTVPAAVKVPEL